MVHMSCVKKEFLSLRHILNEVLTDEIIQCLRFAIFNIYFYLFDCTGSQLQHVGSLTFDEACRIFSCGMWHLFFFVAAENSSCSMHVNKESLAIC